MDNPGHLQFYLLGPLGTRPDFFYIFQILQNNFALRIEEIFYGYIGFLCFPYIVGYLQFYLQKCLILGVSDPLGVTDGCV